MQKTQALQLLESGWGLTDQEKQQLKPLYELEGFIKKKREISTIMARLRPSMTKYFCFRCYGRFFMYFQAEPVILQLRLNRKINFLDYIKSAELHHLHRRYSRCRK